jgi:outer membrane protein assembly factor BamB
MGGTIRRALATVSALTALAGVGVIGAGSSGAVTRAQRVAPGTALWLKRYTGPGTGTDYAAGAVVSPNGSTVFVTGQTMTKALNVEFATIAYNALTGAQKWIKLYTGPKGFYGNVTGSVAAAIAVSPSGKTVFVTGNSEGAVDTIDDYATVAYNAVTGAQLWVRRYAGPTSNTAISGPSAVVVNPNGKTVYVTGKSGDGVSKWSYVTVAYSAATGAQLWVRRVGTAASDNTPYAAAVSPTGKALFVTGTSLNSNGTSEDYETVAYNAVTGAQLWVRRYGTLTAAAVAKSVTVAPGGATVFVTGSSGHGYATVAYNAATGAQRWVKTYGASTIDTGATSMVVSPTGKTVYVTGGSYGSLYGSDLAYTTIAYSTASGAQLWVKRYWNSVDDSANSVALNRAGTLVYVTGRSFSAHSSGDYATVAYNAATGAQLWVRRYNGPGNNSDIACCVVVSPANGTVFVTGQSTGATTSLDYLTIAYHG